MLAIHQYLITTLVEADWSGKEIFYDLLDKRPAGGAALKAGRTTGFFVFDNRKRLGDPGLKSQT